MKGRMGGGSGGGGMGGVGGMQNLMRQANQLQMKIQKRQEELAQQSHTGSAGGDGVVATIKGETSLVALKINEDVLKSGDVEILQDLVLAAVNDALKKARDFNAAEMEKITGGLNVPGLF